MMKSELRRRFNEDWIFPVAEFCWRAHLALSKNLESQNFSAAEINSNALPFFDFLLSTGMEATSGCNPVGLTKRTWWREGTPSFLRFVIDSFSHFSFGNTTPLMKWTGSQKVHYHRRANGLSQSDPESTALSLSQQDFFYLPLCCVPPERGKLPLSNCWRRHKLGKFDLSMQFASGNAQINNRGSWMWQVGVQ